MRHFLSGIALAAVVASGAVAVTSGVVVIASGVAAPALAQSPFSPVVYVNDAAVTRYEVDQRMRFLQLIGAPEADAAAAEQALIDDRLRVQAAREIGVEITPEGLQAGLEEFAARAQIGQEEYVGNPQVPARVTRAYNSGGGRPCRELLLGGLTAGRQLIYCEEAPGQWVGVRPTRCC